ncbi:clumping factor A, partial [Enterococcus sp. 3H8_DIV0648]
IVILTATVTRIRIVIPTVIAIQTQIVIPTATVTQTRIVIPTATATQIQIATRIRIAIRTRIATQIPTVTLMMTRNLIQRSIRWRLRVLHQIARLNLARPKLQEKGRCQKQEWKRINQVTGFQA